MSFDLTDEPWIPCETPDGSVVELGTREVLRRAHELRSIADPSPLVGVALHRHLLAVLHRAYDGPAHMDAWAEIYEAGRFEPTLVDEYLDRVEDRMDLFHSERPFGQARGLVEQFGADPIDMMTLERRSWGTGRELFQHRPAGSRTALTPAEAARALLAYHAFDTGGLVKKRGEPTSASAAPLLGGAFVLLRGSSLFETLTLNLLRYDPANSRPIPGSSDDAPAWERPPLPRSLPEKKEPKRLPTGWLDLLTWCSRRLELVREGDRVTGFVRCVHEGLAAEAPLEPMFAWRRDEKRGPRAVSIRADRAFWRDAHALFRATDEDSAKTERPLALVQLATDVALECVPAERRFTLEVGGLATNKSRVDLVRREVLATTARLLADAEAGDSIRAAQRFGEDAVSALGAALFSYGKHGLSPGEREPDAADVRDQVKSLGAADAAWNALGAEFAALLGELAEHAVALREASSWERSLRYLEARHRFEDRCLAVVHDAFARATAAGEQSARWLKARAIAERHLRSSLAKLDRTTLPESEVA